MGSSTLVTIVSGLRPSLSRSRRIIDHVFLIAKSPSASGRRWHTETRAEETALARGFVAEPPAGKLDEDVFERHSFELDRCNHRASILNFADNLRHRVRAVVHRNYNRTIRIARDLVNAGCCAQHRN